MIALLRTRLGLAIVAAGALLGLIALVRWDAAQDERHAAAARAAQTQERIRHDADAAARAAERDGAAERLRGGTFFAPMPPRD